MSALPKKHYTLEEYFAIESTREERHEYIHGEVFAMAGASENHNQINFNLSGVFYNLLRSRPCRAFIGDMRVKISSLDYTYPDFVVVCSTPQFLRKPLDTLLNPTLIVEIMSPTTADYDRGEKFQRYRQIPSLMEYVLVSQKSIHIEHHILENDGSWRLRDWRGADTSITFPSIDCQIRLGDLYERINLPNEDDNRS
jgi:Uma2 family endonuclease